jgi:hypothetical protein
MKINCPKSKEKAIKYLHKDWLDYRKHYKSKGYPMKETFIEWIKREIDLADFTLKQ